MDIHNRRSSTNILQLTFEFGITQSRDNHRFFFLKKKGNRGVGTSDESDGWVEHFFIKN